MVSHEDHENERSLELQLSIHLRRDHRAERGVRHWNQKGTGNQALFHPGNEFIAPGHDSGRLRVRDLIPPVHSGTVRDNSRVIRDDSYQIL